MRRIFQSRISEYRERKNARSLWMALLLILIFIVAHLIWPSAFPTATYRVAAPLIALRDWSSGFLSGFADYFISKEILARENVRLAAELKKAEHSLLALQARMGTTTVLNNERFDTVYASVLLSPPRSPYDTLVLEAGAIDNISIGDLVVTDTGIAVGKITEVFRDFSRAELLSSPGNSLAVIIGDEEIQAEAQGSGGGTFEALIPEEINIAVGDLIKLPGADNAVLGLVESVDHRDVDFLQLLRFRLPFNIYEIKRVAVRITKNISVSDE